MCYMISKSGVLCAIKSSLIISLACSCQLSESTEINVPNLCTPNHCENCSGGEILECSNDAVSNLRGDLCGCCHSCVRFRDVGESCGSQLAVRSSEYLKKSIYRVTVIATSRCVKGLICKDFTCEKSHGNVYIDINDRRAFEPRGNLMSGENNEDVYEDAKNKDVRKRKIDFPSFVDYSPSITSAGDILSASRSHDSELFDERSEISIVNGEKIPLDPSGHLINVLVGAKEFQLIYRNKIIEDFDYLIKSIDKSRADSIIKEYEAEILSERFKDISELLNSSKEESINDKVIHSSTTWNPSSQSLPDTVRDSEVSKIQYNYFPRGQTRYFPKIRSSRRQLRMKREADEIGKPEHVGTNDGEGKASYDKISKEYGGISVYDIVNKTPRQIEDFSRYFIARKIEKSPQEKSLSDEGFDNDKYESEINIHISGVPRMTDDSLPGNKTEEVNNGTAKNDEKPEEAYMNYDNSEIFESTENNDVTAVFSAEDKSVNFTTPEIENDETFEYDTAGNVTEDSRNDDESTQFFHNNYEFTFPENPVILDDDYNRDIDIVINETVDEFKAQLDRIETRAIIIENAVFDIKRKISVDRGFQNIENRKIRIDNVELVGERDIEESKRDERIPRQRKIIHLTKIPIYDRPFPNNSDTERTKDARMKNVRPDRSNRQWRTVRLKPDAIDASKFWKNRRFRQNRSGENKIVESEVISRRGEITRDSKGSSENNQAFSPRRSSSTKIFKVLPKVLSQRKFPIFLTRSGISRANIFNRQGDPQLFSRVQSNFVANSNFPREEPIWPTNLLIDRVLPVDRSNGRIKEGTGIGARNLQPEATTAEESIVLLETQIPKSINPVTSMIFGQQTADGPTKIMKKHEDNDGWSFKEEQPSLDLFLVNEKNSDLETISSNSKIPETLVLPVESLSMEISPRKAEEVEESYLMSPLYLDYGERPEINDEANQEIVKSELAGTSTNEVKNGSRSLRANRKKRDVSDVSPQPREFSETVNPHIHKEFSMINRTKEESALLKSLEGRKDSVLLDTEKIIGMMKSRSSKGRSKRSVKMIDWLRAAQEYHERLRQVRNAAMKTWLASREILTDTNLTNVKLFTSEVPPYLAEYRPTIFHRDFDDAIDSEKSSENYSTEFRELHDSIGDGSDILTDIFAEYSSLGKNESSGELNENVSPSGSSSLTGRKKFTIITNGNSTIRIEEMPNDDEDAGLDQIGQSSTESQMHKVPISIQDSDYFDHMYESFDADDEDFNYDDPMSGWLDRFDMIDPSTSESSEKNDKLQSSSDDHEEEDPSSRLKRDSPLILFKVKGNPRKEIIIWPSNWKDLIDRHLRLNRDGDAPQRATRRKSYTRLRKIDSKLLPSSFESIGELQDER